jgi:hypothetical protein
MGRVDYPAYYRANKSSNEQQVGSNKKTADLN